MDKYETLIHTLATVYNQVDNGIANCMSLIIIIVLLFSFCSWESIRLKESYSSIKKEEKYLLIFSVRESFEFFIPFM